ncbi:Flp pilus assembly protein CpaB [Massilia cavernae]|uniref:Flp pilus assembly protein CpaB n=1 Tax=Massilia cavernae TaxID=2320864 RepID=A0A418XXY2_9BURK|nr:Flp pilus assembly protein CpaB [Massilia cavernae]RJG17813.1 Flp pilus assembly protein CpaB [Massilia cavernae]
MKNTRGLVMLGIALVLAVAAVIAAASWIKSRASGNTTQVAVAMVDISLGSRITPEMIRMVDWPSGAMPPGAFTQAKLIDTRVTRATIQRGEPIMETKLAPPGTQGGLSAVVANGKRAMTVRVNDVVGVAGFALPGNFVDILVNTQEDTTKTANNREISISKIVLERILVLAIAQDPNRDDTKPKVVNAVTLELTPEQTEKLDVARSVGTLSLVLRNQIDPDPVNTDGATKNALLGAPVVRPAVARAARPVIRKATLVRPREQVDLIKGLDRSTQQF